jgi:protein-disulfide isomerase
MSDDASAPAAPERSSWFSGRNAGVAALAVSLVALGVSVAPYLTGGDFGGRVRAYLIAHPQVLDEVVAARQGAEDNARVAAINTAAARNPSLLAPDPRDPAFGPANAKVTVVEFFDFRCPGCKAVAPQFVELMRANPDVRFVFKDWPILDREGDASSNYAARAALAAHRQGKYLPVYQALMRERALNPESIDRILAANGVIMPAAEAAMASPQMTRHVADIHTTAAALGLQGTPTFFIDGKASPDIDPAEIAKLIQAAKG